MKLYRFLGRLIDLELISLIQCRTKTGDFAEVVIHVEFILAAPPISFAIWAGRGLGKPGPRCDEEVAQFQKAIDDLEAAWAACGRTIPPEHIGGR